MSQSKVYQSAKEALAEVREPRGSSSFSLERLPHDAKFDFVLTVVSRFFLCVFTDETSLSLCMLSTPQ